MAALGRARALLLSLGGPLRDSNAGLARKVASGRVRSAPSLRDVDLTRSELATLAQALNEILNGPEAIEDWELQTRVGVDRDEAKRLLRRLLDTVRSAG